jgi:hypothetical protein
MEQGLLKIVRSHDCRGDEKSIVVGDQVWIISGGSDVLPKDVDAGGVSGPRFPTRFNGEAVFVDLGGGRNVVRTVSNGPEYLPVWAYKFPWGDPDAYDEMGVAIEQAKHACKLPVSCALRLIFCVSGHK